jgi:hypothetical protein
MFDLYLQLQTIPKNRSGTHFIAVRGLPAMRVFGRGRETVNRFRIESAHGSAQLVPDIEELRVLPGLDSPMQLVGRDQLWGVVVPDETKISGDSERRRETPDHE